MEHVFISYSHKDSKYAKELATALEQRGIAVWMDERINYGAQWPTVLEKQVDTCSALLVIMTPASKESRWVQNELARAQRKKKPIYPLLLGGDEPWLSTESTQFIDVRNNQLPPEDFYSLFTKQNILETEKDPKTIGRRLAILAISILILALVAIAFFAIYRPYKNQLDATKTVVAIQALNPTITITPTSTPAETQTPTATPTYQTLEVTDWDCWVLRYDSQGQPYGEVAYKNAQNKLTFKVDFSTAAEHKGQVFYNLGDGGNPLCSQNDPAFLQLPTDVRMSVSIRMFEDIPNLQAEIFLQARNADDSHGDWYAGRAVDGEPANLLPGTTTTVLANQWVSGNSPADPWGYGQEFIALGIEFKVKDGNPPPVGLVTFEITPIKIKP